MPTLLLVYTDIQSFAPNVRGDIQPYKKKQIHAMKRGGVPFQRVKTQRVFRASPCQIGESLWKGEAKVGVGRRG